ncbi:TonB-dependent receptor domain-containing protein [Histophilus somni]|uniref:TonB-dependent receptor domain-containing protein n=1 Tax=Histophilus somni TaxID=731 RepID=UPI003877C6B9
MLNSPPPSYIITILLSSTFYTSKLIAQQYDALPVILVQNEQYDIGRSTLLTKNIDRQQADNAAALVNVLPGVNMSGSPRPGGQNINIWGFGDSEDVRIELDGIQKNFERYRQGSVFIEPELLRRVEVDKGSFSAKYGNGGFGGTLKFMTKNPSDFLNENQNVGGFAKYSYHTNDKQNIWSGAIFLRNQEKNLEGLFYTTVRNSQNIKRPDGSRFLYSENDNKSYLLKVNFYPSDKQQLTLSAVRSNNSGWTPFAAMRDNLPSPSISDIKKWGEDIAWKRKLVYRKLTDESVSLDWAYISDHPLVNLEAKIGWTRTKQADKRHKESAKFFVASMGNASNTVYQDTQFELNNTSQFDTGIMLHTLQTGIQYHRGKRDIIMWDPSKSTRAEYNFGWYQPYYMPSGVQYRRSIFIEDNMELNNFIIKLGLRYDHVRNVGKENLNALRFGAILNFTNLLIDNDYLQFRTTAFNNHGQDEIFKTRGVVHDTKPISNYRNLPGYDIYGLDLEAYYESKYLFGSIAYSYIKGKREASPRDPNFASKTWIAEIPPRKAIITLGTNLPKWNISIGWQGEFFRRQDRSPIDNDPEAGYWSLPKSSGYSLHHLFAIWEPKKIHGMKLSLSIDNIFNRKYNPYLSEKVSGVGRNVKMSISMKF